MSISIRKRNIFLSLRLRLCLIHSCYAYFTSVNRREISISLKHKHVPMWLVLRMRMSPVVCLCLCLRYLTSVNILMLMHAYAYFTSVNQALAFTTRLFMTYDKEISYLVSVNMLTNGVFFSTLKDTDRDTVHGRPTLKDGLCNERIFCRGFLPRNQNSKRINLIYITKRRSIDMSLTFKFRFAHV